MLYYLCRHVSAAILITCLTLVGLGFSESKSSFTTEDILNIWRDQAGRLDDFYVDFDFEESRKAENGSVVAYRRENITYMAKDNLFRTRKQRFVPNTNEVTHDWEFSADGTREYFCDRSAFYGTVGKSLPEQAGIQQSWVVHYLTCVYRMPREKVNSGYESNLIGALEEDKRIEVTEELFEGRNTVVLSQPNYRKIYLDPELNFAVLGSEAIGDQLTFKCRNSNFVEVTEGIWLPLQTERTFKQGSDLITRKTKVNKLKVNNNYTEEDFRIKFEPGIRVRDIDLDMYITPSVADLDGFYLEQLMEMAKERDFIDVYHVNGPGKLSAVVDTNSLTSTQRNISNLPVLGDANVSDSPHSWQQVVTFVSLGLTVVLLAYFWLMHRNKKVESDNL
jgi:hypothetical protein